ncbi:MAG: hypothetical protein ACO3C1_04205 [Ilumatobacteraceae bacterium]
MTTDHVDDQPTEHDASVDASPGDGGLEADGSAFSRLSSLSASALLLRVMVVVMAIGIAALANAYHRVGHPQGDDFALYLRQARSIFEGNIAQVVADNRFTAIYSGTAPFTPFAYPWGFPLLLSPFVNRWGLDYDRLKWVVVACLVVWAVLVHGVVRRRVGRPAALAIVALVFTAPSVLKHTDSLLSEFPAAMAVGAVLFAFDRIHRRHGRLLAAESRSLVVLGALGALAFNTRRENIVLFLALALVQLGEIVVGGAWRSLREPSERRTVLRALAAPHVGFFGTAVLAQFLLPSMLFPENGDKLSYVGARLGDYTGVLTDQLGLDAHKGLGLFLLLMAGLGIVLGVRRRPHLDGFLAAVLLLTLVAISTHFRMVGRYYLQLMPWVVYFVVVAVTEIIRTAHGPLSGGRPMGAVWRWAAVVVPLMPVMWVVGVHGTVVPDQVAEIAASTKDGYVHVGPANPTVIPIFEAVDYYTKPDDVIVFFRARTMTLMTNRRAIQTGSIEITVKVGDYFAQKRNADFYQVAFDRPTLEDLGFTLVWSNPDWYLWRIP